MNQRAHTEKGLNVEAGGNTGELRLNTFEIFSDSFVTGTSLRLVNQGLNMRATLENDAPLNAGQEVQFYYVPFGLSLPTEAHGQIPKLKFSLAPYGTVVIGGITSSLFSAIEPLSKGNSVVTGLYREYVASDLSKPYRVLKSLATLTNIKMDSSSFDADVQFMNFYSRAFLRTPVSEVSHPGLALFK